MADSFGARLQDDRMLSSAKCPRVCIGLPVYNGQRFLRATLDSILAQTFTDFEVVICDNASTDATEQICREYADRDSRIRYIRNDRNIGPAPNYNRCFESSRCELFKWCAADDLMAPTFLARCIDELDRDPSLIGVYPSTIEIDADGKELFVHETELNLMSDWAAVRLARFAFVNHRKHHAAELWAVWRAHVLQQWSPLKGSYPSADRLVIARAILRGKLLRLPDRLFLNRAHGNRSQTYLDKMKVRPGSRMVRYLGCGPLPSYEWWDLNTRGKIVFPEWRWVQEYYLSVSETSLPAPQRFLCYVVLLGLTIKFLPRLVRDVIIGAEQLINRILGTAPKMIGNASGSTAKSRTASAT